ncbi:T9SS type A sorting domain-containing protein [Crocinitomicaceae bacterium]|nr:T9SS type A sorting domain-containing protein [Crocinitomicaceae bacterium]
MPIDIAETIQEIFVSDPSFGNLASVILYQHELINEPNHNPIRVASNPSSESIKSIGEINLNVYPNPSRGQLTVDYSAYDNQGLQIFITAIDGRLIDVFELVGSHGSIDIDLSHIKSGIYIIDLRNENTALSSAKLIIQ